MFNASFFVVRSDEFGRLIRLEDSDRFGPFAVVHGEACKLVKCNMSQDDAQRCLEWDYAVPPAVAAELIMRAENWALRRLFRASSSRPPAKQS